MINAVPNDNAPFKNQNLNLLAGLIAYFIIATAFGTLLFAGVMLIFGFIVKLETLPVPQPWFSLSMVCLIAICLYISDKVGTFMTKCWIAKKSG